MKNNMQCLGRHTLERKNVPELKFANKPKFGFFLPVRCSNIATEILCESCIERTKKIPVLLEKWKGSMQNQSEQIHGLIVEAIPEWSRIYKGVYYQAKIDAGWIISDESERIAEEAYKGAESDTVEMPPRKKIPVIITEEPAQIPLKKEPVKRIRKKVSAPEPVAEHVAEPVAELKPEPVAIQKRKPKVVNAVIAELKPEPIPIPVPVPAPVKKTARAKQVVPVPTAYVKPLNEEIEVLVVNVKKIEIDDRIVYLNNEKDKVYDMKFNYLGRYNRKDNKINSNYADSDAE
jgi:hypothetical protein